MRTFRNHSGEIIFGLFITAIIIIVSIAIISGDAAYCGI